MITCPLCADLEKRIKKAKLASEKREVARLSEELEGHRMVCAVYNGFIAEDLAVQLFGFPIRKAR